MKKWMIVVLAVGLLCGCGARPTFETVEDTDSVSAVATVQQIKLELPVEAAAPTMESSDGALLYECDGYTLTLQTLPGGDLNRTLRQVSGFDSERLRPIKTKSFHTTRYDFAWASAGENGDRISRCALLDDGQNHYAVTVMAEASQAGSLQQTWTVLLNSVTLHTD